MSLDKETYEAAKDDAERINLRRQADAIEEYADAVQDLSDAVEKQNGLLEDLRKAANIFVLIAGAGAVIAVAVLWKLNAMEFATNVMH